jgi:hypothetical protein
LVLSVQDFKEIVSAAGEDQLVTRVLESDWEYLWEAYEVIERLWCKQFLKFHRVHLVLLSEAPFFGEEQSYFYNPTAGATPFFNYKDYEEALGYFGPAIVRRGTVAEKKVSLFNALRELGVLFLDVYPFALNECTEVNYGMLSRSERAELFRFTLPHYFRQKLKLILTKSAPRILFVFRYDRVRVSCCELVREEIGALGIENVQLCEETIGCPHGVVNRDRLREFYKQALVIE